MLKSIDKAIQKMERAKLKDDAEQKKLNAELQKLKRNRKLVEEKLGFPKEAVELFESIALKIEKSKSFSEKFQKRKRFSLVRHKAFRRTPEKRFF